MTLNLLRLNNVPIYEQLQIEEALLRSNEENWCIFNAGSPPAIVLGISGKPHELVNTSLTQRDQIPLIKRFSGGGTVTVDEDTLFVTFIFRKDRHSFLPFPERILRWAEAVYKKALGIPNFSLIENDFVIGEKKCGGNAQYIRKERWLHHTSFLWDFQKPRMEYLHYPKKVPTYREGRSHMDFLCKLRDQLPSKDSFFTKILGSLSDEYEIKNRTHEELTPLLEQPYRKSLTILEE